MWQTSPGKEPHVLGFNMAGLLYDSLQSHVIIVYKFTLGFIFFGEK